MKMMSKYILPCFFVFMIFSAIFYTYLKQDVYKTKQAVKETLYDPESAIFSNFRIRDNFVCGEINAKNRWGGYTGKKRFISVMIDGEANLIFEKPTIIKDFDEYWSAICAES